MRQTTTPYLVAFVASTLIWLWYIARLKTTTVFDGETGTIRRKNLFGFGKTLRFDQVADITLVIKDEGCWQGEYFKISPKNNRFGKGYILTKTYSDFHDELEHLRHAVVPEIRTMLGVAEEGVDASAEDGGKQAGAPVLPEAPRFFSKAGGIYSRRFRRQILFYLVLALGFIIWSVVDPNYISAGLGVVFLVAAFCMPAKVSLDTDTNMVRVYLGFGFWQRTVVPFGQFVNIGSTRTSTNGIYGSTSLDMHFTGKTKTVTLARVYFTGGLDGLAKEAEAIIAAGLVKDGSAA